MDATTMPSTSLLRRLKHDFPALSFVQSSEFRWSPKDSTIYYAATPDAAALLHEVAHAVLEHTEYAYDIELLAMERDAWDYARNTLAKKYTVAISQEQTESMLDSYRDWLHDRSICPTCDATGVQTAPRRYTCLACDSVWRVNEARSRALRRYKVK